MLNFINFDSVNFYGDNIDVAVSEEGRMYVSISQITGYLGLDYEEICEMFAKDPRVEMDFLEDQAIVDLMKLNGFLMLIPLDKVADEFRDDLLRYQVECFEVLMDYWLHGIALNRREIPHDISSKFKDERSVSRAKLTKAVQSYVKFVGDTPDGVLADDIFNGVLAKSYEFVGLEPLHEFEKLTGAEAMYLAWVESVFAATISKFALWQQKHDDVVAEALVYVEDHIRQTAYAWMTMADAVPASAYKD